MPPEKEAIEFEIKEEVTERHIEAAAATEEIKESILPLRKPKDKGNKMKYKNIDVKNSNC